MVSSRKSFVNYTILPGIWPRIRAFITSGFSFLAGLMAVIYQNVGLLPAGHIYLRPENYGKFGLRHVIAEAGRNLVFSRKHIDQVLIYFLILSGLIIIVVQFLLLGVSFVSVPVFAGTLWTQYFVDTPVGHTPSQDIAFVVLDTVFGVMRDSGTTGGTGFFGSCYGDTATNCIDIRGNVINSPAAYPTPFQQAFHGLLHFYTSGIAFVAGLIIIYFVIAIIGETVTSGTPFGQRFSKAWFIPRMIVFFALIAPINTGTAVGGGYINNQGINVAQLITFAVAKAGSNFATNAWLRFIDTGGVVTVTHPTTSEEFYMGSTFLGQDQALVARPNPPEVGQLIQFMHVVRACMLAEKIMNNKDVYPYVVREHSDDSSPVTLHEGHLYLSGSATQDYDEMGGTEEDIYDFLDHDFTLERAIMFSRYRDVVIRFGEYNPVGESISANYLATGIPNSIIALNGLVQNPPGAHDEYWGHVEPTCGEIHFEVTSLDPYVIGGEVDGAQVVGVQETYFMLLRAMVEEAPELETTTECMARAILPYGHDPDCLDDSYAMFGGDILASPMDDDETTQWITARVSRFVIEDFQGILRLIMTGENINYDGFAGYTAIDDIALQMNLGRDEVTYHNNLLMSEHVRERGWVGAALWYNQLAKLNGVIAESAVNIPKPFMFPMVMENVASLHQQNDPNMSFKDRYNPELENGNLADLPRMGDQYIASLLYTVYSSWTNSSAADTVFTRPDKNAITDVISMILGTQGLYDLLENKGVHPLAMLSALGKSMVDASVRNMFLGIVGQGAGQLLSDTFFKQMFSVASSFAFKFGMIGMSIGFILYYVLPLMPFIYFFFAFSGWVKSIFEAIVAMPLWAIAHIRIDGNGLPGPLATNGYFLLFEIFLRPVLIVAGFIISVSLFSALVNVLHDVFGTLTLVATGYDIEASAHWGDMIGAGGRFDGMFTATDHSMSFMRGPIDELFYTVIYAIIVYMIGLSCFKLVDQIPNSIIRWMGVSVSTFQEKAGDPASKLAGNMFRSIKMTNAQITAMMARMQGNKSRAVEDTLIQTM